MFFSVPDKWAIGQTIRIHFLSNPTVHGEPMRDLMMRYAAAWEPFANIKFAIAETAEEADIQTDFGSGGSYSAVGNSNPQDKPYPMRIRSTATKLLVLSSIIHEFGHVLGARHEHQSPTASRITWIMPPITEFYRNDRGWAPYETGNNFNNLAEVYHDHEMSTFDPLSIMMHPIFPEWNNEGVTFPRNYVLSPIDKSFISTMYPHFPRNFGNLTTPDPNYQQTVAHSRLYNNGSPQITLGISSYAALNNDDPTTISAQATSFQDASPANPTGTFVLQLANFRPVGVTWLETPINDPCYRVGTVANMTVTSQPIHYDRPFFEMPGVLQLPPHVIVWICAINHTGNAALSIKVYPSLQDTRGFTLNIEKTPATLVGVSWIAYAHELPNTWAANSESSRLVSLPSGIFTRVPRVAVGVNWITFQAGNRIDFETSAVYDED